jgi:hypothetical protein
MDTCAIIAKRIARTEGIDMAWGWQLNDDTNEREPGYCPLTVVGPCFVVDVIGIARAGDV